MTSFRAPLKVYKGAKEGSANDTGYVNLSQTATFGFDATLVQNSTITLPQNAQILEIVVDITTAYDSATSATLTIGTASAGTQYMSGVNAKTTGRAAPTLTTTQLTNMGSIGTNTSVVLTVTSVGQPTVGAGRWTIRYTVAS